jgi:hypothetical protein
VEILESSISAKQLELVEELRNFVAQDTPEPFRGLTFVDKMLSEKLSEAINKIEIRSSSLEACSVEELRLVSNVYLPALSAERVLAQEFLESDAVKDLFTDPEILELAKIVHEFDAIAEPAVLSKYSQAAVEYVAKRALLWAAIGLAGKFAWNMVWTRDPDWSLRKELELGMVDIVKQNMPAFVAELVRRIQSELEGDDVNKLDILLNRFNHLDYYGQWTKFELVLRPYLETAEARNPLSKGAISDRCWSWVGMK